MTTEAIIQNRFYYDFMQAFHVILPNVHIDNGCEMDLFCIRESGYCEEFEIKLTASDFKNDFKKTCTIEEDDHEIILVNRKIMRKRYVDKNKHEQLKSGCLTANRFNFIIPEELMEKVNVPDYAGLYVYKRKMNYIQKVKQGKLLHKTKINSSIYKKCCLRYQHRMWSARNKLQERES